MAWEYLLSWKCYRISEQNTKVSLSESQHQQRKRFFNIFIMCAADRNLLTGGQSNFCMLEPGNCMKVHKETSVAAHEKIWKLLLENIQFVPDCISFRFCINKCFTQITLQKQDIIYRNPVMWLLDFNGKKRFLICLKILKSSIQCSRQIFVKPVFVNEVGVLRRIFSLSFLEYSSKYTIASNLFRIGSGISSILFAVADRKSVV